MAIYKPTNCSPYFSTFSTKDITSDLPYYFYCQIESSNLQTGLSINGYAIVVYDEDNNQIFPVDGTTAISPINNISYIPDLKDAVSDTTGIYENLNTGINGTYLKIPFIVYNTKATSSVGKNQMLQSKLSDGKTYKWKIYLYQGVTKNGTSYVAPTEAKYYDMTVSSGQVIGSFVERIQAKYSDNIYQNYFIQPVKFTIKDEETKKEETIDLSWDSGNISNGYIKFDSTKFKTTPTPTQVGNRALISSYDYTLGNIYPEKGTDGLSSSQIGDGYWSEGKADAFCIYKLSNDPDLLSTSDKVEFIVNSLENKPSYTEVSGSPGSNYFTTTITGSDPTTSFLKYLTESSEKINITLSEGQRFIFANMNDKEDGSGSNSYNSPWNGIYYVSSITTSTSGETTTTTVQFNRTSDADSWGSLITKTVCCTMDNAYQNYSFATYDSSGKIVIDTTYAGTIGTTSVHVYNELPIEIYPEATPDTSIEIGTQAYYAHYYGKIVYNESGHLCISPLSSLEVGMLWQSKDDPTNKAFNIKTIDKEFWYVTPPSGTTFTQATYPRETKYNIKTCFRGGDTYLFYLKANPTFTWSYYDMNDVPVPIKEEDVIPWEQRVLIVRVAYTQDQFESWRSYYFQLADSSGNIVYTSDVKYDGEIKTDIRGLVNEEVYSLTLVIETESGETFTKTKQISVKYEEKQVASAKNKDIATLNCSTTSIDLSVVSTGAILPSLIKADGTESHEIKQIDSNTGTDPAIAGVSYSTDDGYYMKITGADLNEAGVIYDYISQDPNDSTIEGTNLIVDVDKPILIQSEHEITTESFVGQIFGTEFTTENGANTYSFSIDIPSAITYENGYPIYNNSYANKMLYSYSNNGGTTTTGIVTIYNNGSRSSDNLITTNSFTLPTYLPEKPTQGDYNYLYTVSCQVHGDSTSTTDYKYNGTYWNILGSYNIYNTKLNSVDSIVPIQFPIVAKNASVGFAYNDGIKLSDGSILKDKNGDTIVLFLHGPNMWTDFLCEVQDIDEEIAVDEETKKGVWQYRKKNVLNNTKDHEDEQKYFNDDSTSVWRDGDSLDDGNSTDNKPIVQAQIKITEDYRDREALNGKKFTFNVSLTPTDSGFSSVTVEANKNS